MHIHDESTARKRKWCVKINWSRELTFSARQINFIKERVPDRRGVYCIYSKYCTFEYSSPDWPKRRTSRVIYIGSGWLHRRLSAHLIYKKNGLLNDYLEQYELAYRYDRILDTDILDWPKTVEAALLRTFEDKFGSLPPANRRRETIPDLPLDEFILQQSTNFSFLARG